MQRRSILRRVVHLGGYDPMTPDAFMARFRRELARFARCWGIEARVENVSHDAESLRWTVALSGAGWSSTSTHELLRWDDVIRGHRDSPSFARWSGGVLAFFDFTWNGALWRYLRTAWRYAMFFLYPYSALLAAFLIYQGLVRLALGWAGLPAPAALAGGIACGAGAVYYLVRHTHIGHLLDDWNFAREIVRSNDKVIAERLNRAAARIMAEPSDGELLVVGHSLGAVLASSFIDEALRQPAAPPARQRSVTFLALGSSILKIALHDAARDLRDTLGRINKSDRLRWIEYQALNDVMNFYRSDPVKVLGLAGPSPIVRQARFSRMLDPSFYARIKRNFFRLHCQFISGNDRRAPYDYMMTICGPFSPGALAASRDGAVGWIDSAGAVTPQGEAALPPEADTNREPAP
jgi:hypothetical protein